VGSQDNTTPNLRADTGQTQGRHRADTVTTKETGPRAKGFRKHTRHPGPQKKRAKRATEKGEEHHHKTASKAPSKTATIPCMCSSKAVPCSFLPSAVAFVEDNGGCAAPLHFSFRGPTRPFFLPTTRKEKGKNDKDGDSSTNNNKVSSKLPREGRGSQRQRALTVEQVSLKSAALRGEGGWEEKQNGQSKESEGALQKKEQKTKGRDPFFHSPGFLSFSSSFFSSLFYFFEVVRSRPNFQIFHHLLLQKLVSREKAGERRESKDGVRRPLRVRRAELL
jgi:hypothetical protein